MQKWRFKKLIIITLLFFIPIVGIFSAYSFAEILDRKLNNNIILKYIIGFPICITIIIIQFIEMLIILLKLVYL